ncbi:VOC family protein [Lacticaseibacillus jixiensis]|uniref:VOC family protein n=1 Tax=Lacticaseibacillus jixiensis TaxID=3231926 RepID=UPI0036F2CB5D
MNLPLPHIDHVTLLTQDAQAIIDLMTQVFGLRLIKTTVNQAQPTQYQLYFSDDIGTSGTKVSAIVDPNFAKAQRGGNMLANFAFQVADLTALHYWQKRLQKFQLTVSPVYYRFNMPTFDASTPDGQQYQFIVSHERRGQSWLDSDVPEAYAIGGIGLVTINVLNAPRLAYVLQQDLGMTAVAQDDQVSLFQQAHSQLLVQAQPTAILVESGYGMLHHVAFAVPDDASLAAWLTRLDEARLAHSPIVDRYYFHAVYFKVGPQLLFELATSTPGFFKDESYQQAGKQLVLPPALAKRSAELVAKLPPMDTSWHGR